MPSSWTSKNKKWRVEITESSWSSDWPPSASGYITDKRTNTDIWFTARGFRPGTQYMVEQLALSLGMTFGIEIPAYVQKKAIELSNLAIIQAKKCHDEGSCSESGLHGFASQSDVVHADPGPHNWVRRYVETVLDREGLARAEAVYHSRGEYDAAERVGREAAQLDAAIMNFWRETGLGPRQFDEANNILARIRQGARVEWKTYGVQGFGARRKKKPRQFKVGHIVRFTREFLRNTGQQVGVPINGRVEALQPFGREQWPVVLWSDAREAQLVNPANLELDPRAKAINERIGALGGSFGGWGRPW